MKATTANAAATATATTVSVVRVCSPVEAWLAACSTPATTSTDASAGHSMSLPSAAMRPLPMVVRSAPSANNASATATPRAMPPTKDQS